MTRNACLLLMAVLLLGSSLAAQNTLNKADKLFCKLAFNQAKDLYKEYVNESEDTDPEAYFKLGECYRNLDKPYDAVTWYARSVQHEENSPEDFLLYAQMLQQTQQYEEAKKWYEKYNEVKPDDERGWKGILACENVEKVKANPFNYKVRNATSINSSASDISPVLYEDQLIFTSDRDAERYAGKTFDWTGGKFYNIFKSNQEGPGNLSSPKILTGDANSKYHDGMVTFSEDGMQMIYCRTHEEKAEVKGECDDKEIYNLKLMSAWYNNSDDSWGQPSEKEFANINNKDYVVAHPSLSADGSRLYFTSDNPNFGGYQGGTDLYVSYFEGGTWSTPQNLGPKINTPGNEEFPHIADDSTLYFSSNANLADGGLGGFDIYKSKMLPNGEFAKPTNLGAPINSSRDDFGFLINTDSATGKTYGYFASSRGTRINANAQGRDDIYYFYPGEPIYLKISAKDDCIEKPVRNADITIYKEQEQIVSGTTSDEGIYFNDSLVKPNTKYRLVARYSDQKVEKEFHSYGKSDGDTVVTEAIFKGTLKVEGIVYNKITTKPLENVDVKATSETGQTAAAVTDEKGFYSINLNPDMEYTVVANKFGNQGDTSTINTAGMKCEIINQDFYLTPGSMFLTNVYYYFDKAYIFRYSEALVDLNKLVEYLQDNPSYNIEIRSHTDARATYRYNEALGQRRAQSVKDYLIDKGIDAERLNPVSYGEYCPRNECVDGVECNEVQHQRNRRTEIKVINYDGELVLRTKEKPKWTKKEDVYVEGGKYFEEGKGSNWNNEEDFQGKHGNWRNIPVRKNCDDVIYENESARSDNSSKASKEQSSVTKNINPEPQGKYYRIQFAASTAPDKKFSSINQLGDIMVEETGSYYRYLLGAFKSEQQAKATLEKLKQEGYEAAYIVPYEDGDRKQ